MKLYVEAGFTPMEALQAATGDARSSYGHRKGAWYHRGGERGGLVILGADPLKNISNARRAEIFIRGGVIYDCAVLWRSVGSQP